MDPDLTVLNNKEKDYNITENKGWNEKNEKLLTYWKEESQIIIWLNTQALNYLKKLNKCLSIPAIMISAISSATIFSNLNNEQKNDTNIDAMLVVIGILLIISTFIQSLKEFLNLEKNIRQYINIIKTNQMLILDIQEQLSQEIQDRVNGKEFVNKMKSRKADLVRNSIEIPLRFYKKMEKAVENGEIINYNETFVLYNYLQNQLTNKNIINEDLLNNNQEIGKNGENIKNRENDNNLYQNNSIIDSKLINNKNLNYKKRTINEPTLFNTDVIIDMESEHKSDSQIYDSLNRKIFDRHSPLNSDYTSDSSENCNLKQDSECTNYLSQIKYQIARL